MKTLSAVLSTILMALVAYLAWSLDQWVGIVAYTVPYLLFCAIAALFFWAAWYPMLKKRAVLVGFSAFAILAANFVLPPPSERILRSVLLKLPPGTDAQSIESIVGEEYERSGYTLPRITREDSRIHVSLMSQQLGNCTSLLIQTDNGVVVNSKYSAD
ncbi:MAG: hypothetical protein ACO3RV_03210 [Luteolibacter sp.]